MWQGVRTNKEVAMRRDGVMQEAMRLANDGELGNSNAIRLLQISHTPDELRQVLARFDKQLTPQARGKLFLETLAPLPAHVENQRYEPIFDRHLISGTTYTTAAGVVVPNEVQYYNGQMVQLYGECTNVAPVRRALAGSGYRPLTLRYADGRETAVAHFWVHNLSDTSLKPYNAMFIIVAAVRDDAPLAQSTLRGDENGASSVLSVLDGSYDPTRLTYENRARLFYLRLLDSTQVAIDVGRERMGTDKQPGTIRLAHTGQQLGVVVADGTGNLVAKIDVTLTDDRAALRPKLVQAAATAGIPLADLPAGTEYVFPSVARIGTGPIVPWDWRTDLQPRLQGVVPNTIRFDSRSEDGAMLVSWGFQPKVLGFIPNVRGVVTGVPEAPARPLGVRIRRPGVSPELRPYLR